MVYISVVDADFASVSRLKKIISDYADLRGGQFAVADFDSAEAYLDAGISENSILFVEVALPKMSGIELARKVFDLDKRVSIIFCSALTDKAVEGYFLNAVGFVAKPIQTEVVNLFLTKALLKRKFHNTVVGDKVAIKKDNGVEFVKPANILFVEVIQHYLFFHIDNGNKKKISVRTRGTIRDAEQQLADCGFARCGVSYLVNVARVTKIQGNYVFLDDVRLPISRNYKKDFGDECKLRAQFGFEGFTPTAESAS